MARFRGDFLALYGERFCSGMPALAGPGYSVTVRGDGTAAFTAQQDYEVQFLRLDAGGDTNGQDDPSRPDRILRRALPPTPVTEGQIQEYRRRYLEPSGDRKPDRDHLSAVQEALDSTEIPESYPQITALVWGGDDHLWVGRTVVGDATSRSWDVYDDEGRLSAEVVLPGNLENVLVTPDMVWGTVRDDLGVGYVKGFRLQEAGASD
jgi:hypothetical protein